MTQVAKPSPPISEMLVAVHMLQVAKATAHLWRATFLKYGALVWTEASYMSMESAITAGCKKALAHDIKEFGIRIGE